MLYGAKQLPMLVFTSSTHVCGLTRAVNVNVGIFSCEQMISFYRNEILGVKNTTYSQVDTLWK